MNENELTDSEWVDTLTLKVACEDIQADGLGMNARVEVYIEGDDETCYEIVEISHFHVIANVVLTIREIADDEYFDKVVPGDTEGGGMPSYWAKDIWKILGAIVALPVAAVLYLIFRKR